MFVNLAKLSIIALMTITMMVNFDRNASTVRANTVNNGSARAYCEAVIVKNMTFHILQKFTAKVNKLAAFNTFKMKMLRTAITVGKLIAGANPITNYHLFY